MQHIRYSRYFKASVIILDIMVIATVFVFFFIQRNQDLQLSGSIWEKNAFSILLLSLFWILLSGRTKIYSVPRNLTYTLFLERFVTQMILFLFGIILLGKVSDNPFIKNERFWLAFSLFASLLTIKTAIFSALKYIRTKGYNSRNIMLLNNNNSDTDVLEKILQQRKDYGYRLFSFPNENIDLTTLQKFWKDNRISTVYLPMDFTLDNPELDQKIHQLAEDEKVKIALIPNISQNNFFEYELNYLETQPILSPAKFPLDYFSNYLIKKAFDTTLSVLILVFIFSWLYPIIALLIKLDSKGPILFKQKRYGFHDQVFYCYKFRTMVVNDDSASKTTSKNDKRITSIGKFLRKSSLDELPQLFNVLKGDMSLVGPRPHMLMVDDYYKAKIGRYTVRSLVKPGITGLAQVNGLRGDDGDMEIEMQKRILTDSFYVKNWSFVLDLVIVMKTVGLLIFGDKKAQ